MAKLFVNSGDPDQTPRSAASDRGLHCLQITLLRVSRLQWVKDFFESVALCLFARPIKDFDSPFFSCWIYKTNRRYSEYIHDSQHT